MYLLYLVIQAMLAYIYHYVTLSTMENF